MITKAKRLKSIGKFYDFSSSANDLDWHKNTFVFAPNAYGKTTFVNVLRSLRDNNPKLILARKTLGMVTAKSKDEDLQGANRELITRFEKKIQATLARVWGE
ncbi:MAG: hypothetical protein HY807_09595 [Nitrospirae bacterium]|nr:hypothetical protein [Nitrospirota bacterium]